MTYKMKKLFWFIVLFSGLNALYAWFLPARRVYFVGYHSITDTAKAEDREGAFEHLSIDKAVFERHILWMQKQNFVFLKLQDLLEIVRGARNMPEKAAVIYFDDGFRNVKQNAYPILKTHGIPAIMFLTTDLVDQNKTLWERVPLAGERIFLTWDEARSMIDIFGYGSHSVSHPKFTQIDKDSARKEIQESKRRIKEELDAPVAAFSYPYGRNTNESRVLLEKEGYEIALTTAYGFNTLASDWLQLKKITPLPTDTMVMFKLKFGIYYFLKWFL